MCNVVHFFYKKFAKDEAILPSGIGFLGFPLLLLCFELSWSFVECCSWVFLNLVKADLLIPKVENLSAMDLYSSEVVGMSKSDSVGACSSVPDCVPGLVSVWVGVCF